MHADSINVHPRAELARVYDPFEPAAKEVGGLFEADWTTDVDAVIADPSIDAVVVASPTATHVDLLTRAVRAGKAVLCEKPIDLDLARVDACQAEIGELTGRVMVGFNRRFDPTFADIRARVAAGEIGRLEQLIIVSRDPAPPPAGLRRELRWTVPRHEHPRPRHGPVLPRRDRAVTATGANVVSPEIAEAGDIDSAVLVLPGGTGSSARSPTAGAARSATTSGWRRSASSACCLPPTSCRQACGSPAPRRPKSRRPYFHFFLDRYTPAYRAELDHFVTAIEKGTPFSPGFADGRAALVLADAANESLRTGATVEVTRSASTA